MNAEESDVVIRGAVQARAREVVVEPIDVDRAWVRFQDARVARQRAVRRRWIVGTAVGAVAAGAAAVAIGILVDRDGRPDDPIITPSLTQSPLLVGGPQITIEPQALDGPASWDTSYHVVQGKVTFSLSIPAETESDGMAFGLDSDAEFTTVFATFADHRGWPQIGVLAPDSVYDQNAPVYLGDDATVPAPTTIDGWAEWFQAHPHWTAGPSRPAELAGASGVTLELTDVVQPEGWITPPRIGGLCCVVTGSPSNSGFLIEAGGQAQVWIVDVDGVPVVVIYTAHSRGFDEARTVFDRVLESIDWNAPLAE